VKIYIYTSILTAVTVQSYQFPYTKLPLILWPWQNSMWL